MAYKTLTAEVILNSVHTSFQKNQMSLAKYNKNPVL